MPQQLAALERRHPRPSLYLFDKPFWVITRWVWSAWQQCLLIVTPETVVGWLADRSKSGAQDLGCCEDYVKSIERGKLGLGAQQSLKFAITDRLPCQQRFNSR